jgi:hypothetical protein
VKRCFFFVTLCICTYFVPVSCADFVPVSCADSSLPQSTEKVSTMKEACERFFYPILKKISDLVERGCPKEVVMQIMRGTFAEDMDKYISDEERKAFVRIFNEQEQLCPKEYVCTLENAFDYAIDMTKQLILKAPFTMDSDKKYACIMICLKAVLVQLETRSMKDLNAWRQKFITDTLKDWCSQH